jgi:hypothetical protein
MYNAIFIKIPLLPVKISYKEKLTLDHCEGEIETKIFDTVSWRLLVSDSIDMRAAVF